MNANLPFRAAALLLMMGLIVPASLRAELPELGEKPWLGCFAVYKGSKVRLKIHAEGGVLIEPHYEKGEPRPYINIPVTYSLERTMPNGAKRLVEVIPASLESDDEETDKFKETVIRGEFEGGAKFEVMIEQKRGMVSLGGRITDPGTYDPMKIQFHVSARVLNFYGRKKLELANNPKAFRALIEEDSLELETTAGKKQEFDFIEARDLAAEEFNGPGVAEAVVEIGSIKRRLVFEASGDSAIRLSNRKGTPLNEGMVVNWTPDAGKDPRAEARFVIEVR